MSDRATSLSLGLVRAHSEYAWMSSFHILRATFSRCGGGLGSNSGPSVFQRTILRYPKKEYFAFLVYKTIPEYLFLSEVKNPMGKEPFLKHPATAMEWHIGHMAIPAVLSHMKYHFSVESVCALNNPTWMPSDLRCRKSPP